MDKPDEEQENTTKGTAAKLRSLSMKFMRSAGEASLEAGKTAHAEDKSSQSAGGVVLALFLLLFKIPLVAKGLTAIAPKIKQLVDKLPRKAFSWLEQRFNGNDRASKFFGKLMGPKVEQHVADYNRQCNGKNAFLVTVNGFVDFIKLTIGLIIFLVLFSIIGCIACLAGEGREFGGMLKFVCVLAILECVIYALVVLWTMYYSVAIVRLRSFAKDNDEDIKSVVFAIGAFILNIIIAGLIVWAAVYASKH